MAAASRTSAMRVARILLATGVVVLVAQSLADLVASLGFHSYHSVVDLDRNNGIPDVASTLAIVCAAVGAAVLAVREERGRLRLALLTVVLGLIALADGIQAPVDGSTLSGRTVFVAILLAALLLVSASLSTHPWARTSTLVGLGCLAVAVLGGLTYGSILTDIGLDDLGRGDVTYELGIVAKQGLELAGWTLIAVGLWAAAGDATGTPSEARGVARLGAPP